MLKHLIKPVMSVCLGAFGLTGCSVSEPLEVQTLFGYAMGTSYSVKLVSTLSDARGLQLGVEGVLADINNRMSTYLPRSDLSLFAAAPVDSPVSVDAKTIHVVERALQIAKATDGYFDPTVAPLVDLWGFGPTVGQSEVPKPAELKQLQAQVGYAQLVVNAEAETLTKLAPRALDLSAIAKGYAVDLVADYLGEKGFTNYLVEVGGEMRFSGTKPDQVAWRIAIENPDAESRSVFKILEISTGAVATSGDYRNFFEVDGQRYSHTINPKTGYPVAHDLASVTVVTPLCIDADAYATALMAMGREPALSLAEAKNLAVLLIYKEGVSFRSVQSSQFTAQFGLFETNI
jgi:thiamine biosynthesis lipoprotein